MPHLFIQSLQDNPRFFFAVVITVVVSIVLHELAHGLVAIRLGDRTPVETGHMTLNPLVHMGGASLAMLAFAGIAWGAMPVNPSRLRGRYGDALVSLAGPLTNLILGTAALTAVGVWDHFDPRPELQMGPLLENLRYLLVIFGSWNWLLCLFNLLPVPPLDGSHVAADLVPAYRELTRNPDRQWVFAGLFLGVFWLSGYAFGWINGVSEAYIRLLAGH